MNSQTKIRVGAWLVSPALNVLEHGERSLKLEPRAMDVLVYLADHAGDVVSVEELLGSVWKGLVVGDGSVYLAIKQLRQALAIPNDDTVHIETIPKRGYRLTVPVERVATERIPTSATPSNALPPRERAAVASPARGAAMTPTSSSDAPTGARFAWLVASALAVALVAALVPATRGLLRGPADETATHVDLEVPGYVAGALAVSPDGRFVAYAGDSDGERRIWLRPLAAAAARPVGGTENAKSVFWSPDSRHLAFMTDDGTLKRVDVAGGPVQTLAQASTLAWGSGAWSRDGAILHTIQAGPASRAPSGPDAKDAPTGFPIGTVSAAGGDLDPVTWPDVAHGETGHFVPRLLPDDAHFVYIGGGPGLPMATIYVGSRTTPTRTALASIEDLVKANRLWNLAYADGHLLYARGTTLVAQRFDAATRTIAGEPLTVAHDVDDFAVSATGVLVYSESAPSPVWAVPQERRLSWFDRSGRRLGEIDARAAFAGAELSPDAHSVAVTIVGAKPGVSDIAIVDAERGASLPITVDDANDGPVVWSADGTRIAFGSGRGSIPFTPSAIYEQSASGTGPQRLLFSGVAGELVLPSDWSADVILFSRASKVGAAQMDIWALPTSGERGAFALLASPSRKHGARLSPDGRWIAYTTDESGRDEVVVQPYPIVDRGKWPISTRGGSSPRWRSDGREIFYVAPDRVLTAVEVAVSDGDSFDLGQSRELFAIAAAADVPVFDYAVSASGEQFLVSEPVEGAAAEDERPVRSLRVIFNWTGLLKLVDRR
jgi:DNA-binding winged helix-turn-helix (wHTH) protein/Tol biopolymer transport system component